MNYMDYVDTGIYYVVKLENNTYYKGGGASLDDTRTTDNITNARLYSVDWQIYKDLYLQAFLGRRGLNYKVLRVESKRTVRIIS